MEKPAACDIIPAATVGKNKAMGIAIVTGSAGLIGSESVRKGDHIWYIRSLKKFQEDYPGWEFKYGRREIMVQIGNGLLSRL